MGKWRWSIIGWIWIEAWLAVPRLADYLALPAPFAPDWMWSKIWAMLMVPAAVTLVALVPDLRPSLRDANWTRVSFLLIGGLWQTQYLLHHVPPAVIESLIERWTSSALAVTSLTVSLSSPRENAPPALEILASAALVMTFVARPLWANGISIVILLVTVAVLSRRPQPH